MVGIVLSVYYAAGKMPAPHAARNAVWDVRIPKSCENKAFLWMGGRTHVDDYPVLDFLKLQDRIESCGGHLTLEKRAGN